MRLEHYHIPPLPGIVTEMLVNVLSLKSDEDDLEDEDDKFATGTGRLWMCNNWSNEGGL